MTEETTQRVVIDPMAAVGEARSLNEFYANRVLILANEVAVLRGQIVVLEGSQDEMSRQHGEELSRVCIERDRIMTDLTVAQSVINELRAPEAVPEVPEPLEKPTPKRKVT